MIKKHKDEQYKNYKQYGEPLLIRKGYKGLDLDFKITDYFNFDFGAYYVEVFPTDDGYNIDLYLNADKEEDLKELDYMIMLYEYEESDTEEENPLDATIRDVLTMIKNNLKPVDLWEDKTLRDNIIKAIEKELN